MMHPKKDFVDYVRGRFGTEESGTVDEILQEYYQQQSEQGNDEDKKGEEKPEDKTGDGKPGDKKDQNKSGKEKGPGKEKSKGRKEDNNPVEDLVSKLRDSWKQGGKEKRKRKSEDAAKKMMKELFDPANKKKAEEERELRDQFDPDADDDASPEESFYKPQMVNEGGYIFQDYQEQRFVREQIIREFKKIKPKGRFRVKGTKRGSRMAHDLAVREVTDIMSGGKGTGKIYIKNKITNRDVEIGMLIDTSGSTSSQVGSRTVIDIEALTALLLGDAANEMGDAFSIYNFPGYTSMVELRKGPNEGWTEYNKKLVSEMRPGGGTPLAEALYEVLPKMRNSKAKKRIMFVITDGAPNDLQRASLAIKDYEREGIKVVYLNIDTDCPYFKEISQHASFAKAYNELEELPLEIANIYKALT
jgi:nitric oxide reductase activation protein